MRQFCFAFLFCFLLLASAPTRTLSAVPPGKSLPLVVTLLLPDHEFQADQATNIHVPYEVTPIEKARWIEWEVTDSKGQRVPEASARLSPFRKEADKEIIIARLSVGTYTLRVRVLSGTKPGDESAEDATNISVQPRVTVKLPFKKRVVSQNTNESIACTIASEEKARLIAWDLKDISEGRSIVSIPPHIFTPQDKKFLLPKLPSDSYELTVKAWSTEDAKAGPDSKDTVQIEVPPTPDRGVDLAGPPPIPLRVELVGKELTLPAAKVKDLKVACYVSPQESVKLIQWQVLDKDGKPLPMASQTPQPFTQAAQVQTLPALPPGDYTVRVSVWDKPEATDKPTSLDERSIHVVEAAQGMAFLVGIDAYPDNHLRYMVSDAEKLKQELRNLGYSEGNIATVYGKYEQTAEGFHFRVEMSPNIRFNPDDIPTSQVASGNLVSKDLLDQAFANFKKLAEQQGAKHIILFYGGHGQSEGDINKGELPRSVFRLPDNKTKWSDEWAQELVNLPSNPTVIGYYDISRKSSIQGVSSLGSDINYFGFPSSRNGQGSYEDDPDPSKTIGINGGFFTVALIQAMEELSGKHATVAELYVALSKHLANIVQKAKVKRPELGEQSLPDIASIAAKQQGLPAFYISDSRKKRLGLPAAKDL